MADGSIAVNGDFDGHGCTSLENKNNEMNPPPFPTPERAREKHGFLQTTDIISIFRQTVNEKPTKKSARRHSPEPIDISIQTP
jgi:hypothetical protein